MVVMKTSDPHPRERNTKSKSKPLFLSELYGSFRGIIIKPPIHFRFLSNRKGEFKEILPALSDKRSLITDHPIFEINCDIVTRRFSIRREN
jgi:hypothetical protein